MDFRDLTIKQIQEGYISKQFTVKEVLDFNFAQIESFDGGLHAYITRTKESAYSKAAEADSLIEAEGASIFEKFPLLGITYACKDNFSTSGVETTAGSNILKGYVPPYESTVTGKLSEAGAIMVGKVNMDAFAHGSSTENSDFFTTLNPWDIQKVAGGSSGGSAVAVAAGMCVFAIGSETSGSIRGPAAWCGVTGFKPTYGRVSRYGVIAMASSTDSPGPLTRFIEDSALVLKIIAGKDYRDATTGHVAVTDYLSNMKKYSIKGKKIGIPKSYFELELDQGVSEAVMLGAKALEKAGAELVDIELLDPKYSIAVYTIIQRSEVSSNLARFDGIRYGKPRTSFGFEAKKRMMLGAYALSSGYYDQYYAKAQKVRTLLVEDFKRAFSQVDMILGPTMPTVALNVGESQDNAMFGEMMDVLTNPSSMAGLCAVSLPVGFSHSMPVGMQLIGDLFAEDQLFGASYVYQSLSNYHKEKPNLYA